MRTVKGLISRLDLELVAGEKAIGNDIKSVYIGDLLSWVMSHVKQKDVWITIQTNINVVAVAALGEVSCVIIAEGAEIEEITIKKAEQEDIPLLRSNLSAYDLAVEINKYLELK
ncbi:MAG: AraC family transcriptional regulator [Clostridiaceae bacterium]|nr:AraC family transcriptional regulator [Clostridiaceae bacterium]